MNNGGGGEIFIYKKYVSVEETLQIVFNIAISGWLLFLYEVVVCGPLEEKRNTMCFRCFYFPDDNQVLLTSVLQRNIMFQSKGQWIVSRRSLCWFPDLNYHFEYRIHRSVSFAFKCVFNSDRSIFIYFSLPVNEIYDFLIGRAAVSFKHTWKWFISSLPYCNSWLVRWHFLQYHSQLIERNNKEKEDPIVHHRP